jgi:DNA invertase Pin-like site-specific DNA recombinase
MTDFAARCASLQRCAIYTRKSTEHGLEREVNSLEAQRETCSAYIRSQRHRGWSELETHFDDGGESGGKLDRPALQALIAEIEAGRVEVVVIYKMDRLSRSLLDFVRLMDLFERYGVSFVSVTQAFDTSDSMGRLILNVLLTFAQFERELLGDRLRDKFAALRRRGKFIGGNIPLGYDLRDGRLYINEAEALVVRRIFNQYPHAATGNHLLKQLRAEGVCSKRRTTAGGKVVGGGPLSPGTFHTILRNPLYLGQVSYKGLWHPGEHAAIISREQWDAAQARLKLREGQQFARDPSRYLLLGSMFDAFGRKMKINSRQIEGRVYRYYCSEETQWGRRQGLKRLWTKSDDAEQVVITALTSLLQDSRALGAALATRGEVAPPPRGRNEAGQLAALRLARLDRRAQRQCLNALVRRIDVDHDHVRLTLSRFELARFVEWDGVGLFKAGAPQPGRQLMSPHILTIPCAIVSRHRIFSMPIEPAMEGSVGKPNPALLRLLDDAHEAQRAVLADRKKSVPELAKEHRCGPSFFARLIRLNYLAPDIKAAIVDGRHPPNLTRKRLAFCSLPLDWSHQRALLGFPAQLEQGPHQRTTLAVQPEAFVAPCPLPSEQGNQSELG